MNSNSINQTLVDLRKPLLIAICLLGFSTALFSYSYMHFSQLKGSYESTQTAYRTITQGVSAAKSDIEIAQKYSVAFKSLSLSSASGDFAKQRALDHLEQELNAKVVTPKSYSLSARETLSSTEFSGLEKYEVSKHAVMMEVQLAHELRLLNFIEKMTAENPGGITTMEACEIRVVKNEGKSEDKRDLKTETKDVTIVPIIPIVPLDARCLLTWYRFEPKALVPSNGLPGLDSPLNPNAPLNAATFGVSTGKK